LFDDFSSPNPADYLAGFPMHPHRGIETVTYILDGDVRHRDSIGNSGVIGKGDLQWMSYFLNRGPDWACSGRYPFVRV
jgi:redox-sensitive bicupin YhaK (pirin superfamily)